MLRVTAVGVCCELGEHVTARWRVCRYIPIPTMKYSLTNPSLSRLLFGRLVRAIRLSQYRRPLFVTYGMVRNRRLNINFKEFADLSDGRRVTVRSDYGTGWSWHEYPFSYEQPLIKEIEIFFKQYEQDEPTTPEDVVERIRSRHGIDVDRDSVAHAQRAPLLIELSPRFREVVRPPKRIRRQWLVGPRRTPA